MSLFDICTEFRATPIRFWLPAAYALDTLLSAAIWRGWLPAELLGAL